MTTPHQFRARAVEFGDSIKRAHNPEAIHELQRQQRTFTELADNEEWLASNPGKTVRLTGQDVSDRPIGVEGGPVIAEDEGHILACLGAAVIMRWNTLPTKLQKELFDDASSTGELLQSDALKGQIARFLHNHKDDDATPEA